MDFYEELSKTKSLIDAEIKEYIYNKDCYQKKVLEAINYSIFTGGKRLRPIMAIKSYEMFNNNYKEVMPFAVAIEMIHTYSLIHDDLPSMDDDDIRRGKPTNHKVFGEAMAILAGDGLLNLAFETMGEYITSNSKTINDYERYTRALSEISKYSGIHGMIGGQVVDLLGNYNNMDEEKLMYMYKTKTAALIQSALVVGAIIGGASEVEIENIREFGLYLGLAYQIRDDILDEKKDKAIKKLTYLSFNDINKAQVDIKEYSQRAINCLNKVQNADTSFFVSLTNELVSRNK